MLLLVFDLMKKNKIALWSGPRNISTALMYSFANRQDTKVIDEPLFGYFLKHTGVWRPSAKEVLDNMDLNSASVVNKLIYPDINQSVYLTTWALTCFEGDSITLYFKNVDMCWTRTNRTILLLF